MKNPIYKELKSLKLISDSNLINIGYTAGDKKNKVIKDINKKIIFLEKYENENAHYNESNDKIDLRKSNKKIKNIKTSFRNDQSPKIQDDKRRVNQFEKMLKNKDILDVGCAWGGFLRSLKNAKSLNGVELRSECVNFIKKKIKKINISTHINSVQKKFDVITMFHVLEHLPYQVETLKQLKPKLKKNGKIIIEVPHAEDFLILQEELREFKDFIFWSDHLVLHTYKSLKKILTKAGFKNIKISFYQRYNFSNHLGWFLRGKPGGHVFYDKIISEKLNNSYCENLIKLRQTDTLIAIAE